MRRNARMENRSKSCVQLMVHLPEAAMRRLAELARRDRVTLDEAVRRLLDAAALAAG